MIKILRCSADDSPIADKVAITHRHVIGQNRMSLDDAIITKGNSLLDNRIGTDLCISSKPDLGTDKCCGMDIQGMQGGLFHTPDSRDMSGYDAQEIRRVRRNCQPKS